MEEERIKREREEWTETTRKRRESGVVGGTKWKKCWQAGCSMAGKWDSRTAVFLRRGTLEIGVTLFHCQGEEREGNTRDVVMYREWGVGSGWGKKNWSKTKKQTLEQLLLYYLMVLKRGKEKGPCVDSRGVRGTSLFMQNIILVHLQGDMASARLLRLGEEKTTFPMIQLLLFVVLCWHL